MELSKKQDISFYQFPNLNIPHAFLGREYNFASTLSSDELSSQYKKVETILEVDKIALVHQTHSNKVKMVTKENYRDMEECDGMLTNEKGIALATKVADCQEILLYDAKKKVIGNIHSGWKGTLGRIVINAITLMQEEYSSNVKDIQVYFCPSICQECFEVKEDVYLLFKDSFDDIVVDQYIRYEKDNYYIDTIGINEELLLKEGILKENITNSHLCTKCFSNLFHSYRVDKENAGRNLAVICL